MPEKRITIHNKISSNYRQIHVDGVYGGITTQGLINLSFFSERSPIPTSSEFKITDDNKLGTHVSDAPDSKKGILREFEFGIYTDISVAKSLIQLLSDQIEKFENEKIKQK